MPEQSTVVTFLEMTEEPILHIAPPSQQFKLMLFRAEAPSAHFYRYLYDHVGRTYHWNDRRHLSDEDLLALIRHEKVEIWVAYAKGEPAGFFEVDGRRAPAEVELVYLGLMPAFQGLGLGSWLLAEAIRACWARKPARVIVETCTLDSPAALPLYQKMGFTPYARSEKLVRVEG